VKRPAAIASQPFSAAYKNILFADRPAALYRLDTVSYSFFSQGAKEQCHARLAWFAYSVEADFSLYRVSRAYPADRYVADTIDLLDHRAADRGQWERYLQGHAEHIAAMRSFDIEVYLLVALREGHRKPWQRNVQRDARALGDAEQHTFDTVTEYLPAHRATSMEIQWLLRRAGTRGIGEPELDANWRPPALTVTPTSAFEPRGATTMRHAATITEQDRGLIVDTEHGRSYQAMLALGALPRTMQFPGGAELLFTPLEALAFPVDAAMHVRWVSNADMQKLVRNRVRDADNSWEDQAHNPQSWAPEEHRIAARDAHEYFSTEPYPPGLETSVLFALGADSDEERRARVAQLRRRYGAIKLYQPLGIQRDLYDDHLPHPGPAIVGDYADVQTMNQFGAYMPIGTHHAGARRGIYIARTIPGTPRPVKFDPTEASRTNRSGSILMVGALGRGKTTGAQFICYFSALRGSLVVDIDPKPDHNLEGLPGLEDRVHAITLTGDDANRGLLDPLVVAPEALREDLANAYLIEILPQAPPPWETQIRRAVKRVLAEPSPSCQRVLDVLMSSPDTAAREVGAALDVWAISGLGQLGFGDGTRDAVHAERPVTMIKASALTLPPPGTPRADYQQDERLGAATLKLVVGYAMRLVQGDRSRHKVIHFDEAHVLLGTNDGRRFLDRINRMGRSMNVTLLLSTQLLGDVGSIESLIGTRMIFGQETDAEARAVLPIVGLDPNDDGLVKMLTGFTNGQCLLRGIDGRVAAMQIDVVDPEILKVLSTTPEEVASAGVTNGAVAA
jgi:hypothetical protein